MPWLTWLRRADAGHASAAGGELALVASQAHSEPRVTMPIEPDEDSAVSERVAAAPALLLGLRTSGLPDERMPSRTVRVFVSSAFGDMQAERAVLERTAFPWLQRRYRERGIEVFGVDLRSDSSEAELTLDVCLAEVDRCRPWFLGLMGQRYGSVLPEQSVPAWLPEIYPVVREALGRSLSELEIMHAVLGPERAAQALLFERVAGWIDVPEVNGSPNFDDPAEGTVQQLEDLKARAQAAGPVQSFTNPVDVGPAVEKALEEALEVSFPASEAADGFAQAHYLHSGYARDRLGHYLGGEGHFKALNKWVEAADAPLLMITGAPGAGKGALIAHWLQAWRAEHPQDILFAHYLGAGPECSDPANLLRRLWEHLNRATGDDVELPVGAVELVDLAAGLARRLAAAAQSAARVGGRIIIALDGLDKMVSETNLRWLPQVLAPNVKLLASCIEGESQEGSLTLGWSTYEIGFLSEDHRRELFLSALGPRAQPLPAELLERILANRLSALPLFLKTIAAGLRQPGPPEAHLQWLERCAQATDLAVFYNTVLEHFEARCPPELVRRALSALWASRAGLEEGELMALAAATPLAWARFRQALSDTLCDRSGRITLGHELLGRAVVARYLPTTEAQREAHLLVARHFETRTPDARAAEELPYQLLHAHAWEQLQGALVDMSRLGSYLARGAGELLGYWLVLRGRGRDLEQLLCEAFDACTGQPAQWQAEELELATALASFLDYASAAGLPAVRLAARRTLACRRLRGVSHPDTLASLSDLASTLRRRGDLESAQKLQERVLQESSRHLGAEHRDTLVNVDHLARTLRRRGDLEGAQQLHERVVKAHAHILGPEHPETLRQAARLGVILCARVDLEQAQQLQERVLETAARVLGAEHPDTLAHMAELATTQRARGELEAAQKLQERTLEISARVLGPAHPDTLQCMNGIAHTCLERGDRETARKLQERVLKACIALLGTDHAQTLRQMADLAVTLLSRGSLERAQKLQERVLDARRRLQGRNHPDTLQASAELAGTLRTRGDLAGARELQERVVDRRMRLLGLKHPDTIRSMAELAQTLRSSGERAAAQELQERALEEGSRHLGPEHPETLKRMRELAVTLVTNGDLPGAQELQERALQEGTRQFGAEHPETLRQMRELAATFASGGDLARALELQDRAFKASTRVLGVEHPETLASMQALATTLSTAGDLEAAQRLQERLLKASTRLHGPEHPETLKCVVSLGNTLRALGDRSGEKLQQRVLETRIRLLGPQHAATLRAMTNLAGTLWAHGELDGARRLYERVLDMRLRLHGPDSSDTLSSMSSLGQILVAGGNLEGAQKLLEHVVVTSTRHLGPEHPLTLTAARNLAAAHSAVVDRRSDLSVAQSLPVGSPSTPDTLPALYVVPVPEHLKLDYQVHGLNYEVAPEALLAGAC